MDPRRGALSEGPLNHIQCLATSHDMILRGVDGPQWSVLCTNDAPICFEEEIRDFCTRRKRFHVCLGALMMFAR